MVHLGWAVLSVRVLQALTALELEKHIRQYFQGTMSYLTRCLIAYRVVMCAMQSTMPERLPQTAMLIDHFAISP